MSATPPSRELVITYGSYSCSPDANGFQLRWNDSLDAFELTFAFLVTGSTAAAFVSALESARAAFRKPFEDLSVALGGSTLHSYKGSDSTGLENRASIVNEEHVANTGRSARLTARIVGGRPANNVSTSGLREYGVSVSYTPNRRALVTLSGVFTAVAGTGARAKYTAGIDGLASAAKSALSIATWELIGEPTAASSYNDQTLTFSRDYQQISYGQGGSGDDSTIFGQQLRVSVRKTSSMNAPGGPYQFVGSDGYESREGTSGDAVPLVELSATYDAWLTFGTDGFQKWQGLKSFVLGVLAGAAGRHVTVVSEQVSVLEDDNRLSVQLAGLAAVGGAIRREYSQETNTDGGMLRVPVWKGDAKTKYAYQGPSQVRVTRTLMEETTSGGGSSGGSAGGSGGGATGPGTGVDLSPFGFGADIGEAFPMTFGNLFSNFGFGGETDTTRSGQGGVFYDGPFEPTQKQLDSLNDAGGGGGGGGGASATAATDVVTDRVRDETMKIGLESPITVHRRTRTQIVEQYKRLGEPAAYGAGPGTA